MTAKIDETKDTSDSRGGLTLALQSNNLFSQIASSNNLAVSGAALKSSTSTPLNSDRTLLKSSRVVTRVPVEEIKLKKFNYLL